jgi:hypothetical protein
MQNHFAGTPARRVQALFYSFRTETKTLFYEKATGHRLMFMPCCANDNAGTGDEAERKEALHEGEDKGA